MANPGAPPGSVVWRPPELVKINYSRVDTEHAPAAIAVGDQILLVWITKTPDGNMSPAITQNRLAYSVGSMKTKDEAKPDGLSMLVWKDEQLVRTTHDDGEQIMSEYHSASTTPALALFEGEVHMVYPDQDTDQLTHLRFKPEAPGHGSEAVWSFPPVTGTLSGLGDKVRTEQRPCLAAWFGFLWCIFQPLHSEGWSITRWMLGREWTNPVPIRGLSKTFGPPALIELEDRLQLLLTWSNNGNVVGGGFAPTVYSYRAWTSFSTWPMTEIDPSFPGVSAVSFQDRCIAAFADGDVVNICQYVDEKWQIPEKIQMTTNYIKTKTPPTLATLNNDFFCFWANDSNALQVASGRSSVMPRLSMWMSAIDDNTLISDLTIPGTHDALAAYTRLFKPYDLAAFPYAETQTMGIFAQLDCGIRYFDLRGGFNSEGKLIGVHGALVTLYDERGAFAQELKIEDVFQAYYAWLDRNKLNSNSVGSKADGIVLQIKGDGLSSEKLATFSQKIHDMIMQDKDHDYKQYWRLEDTIPRMSDLRGRLQLVRRFPMPKLTGDMKVFGIDVTDNWPENGVGTTPKVPQPGKPSIYIQDKFQWQSSGLASKEITDAKWKMVREHMESAQKHKTTDGLWLNFASATAPAKFCGPGDIAMGWRTIMSLMNTSQQVEERAIGVNEYLTAFFNKLTRPTAGSRGFGVILMDFPEYPRDLISAMVQSNFGRVSNPAN